MAYVALYRRWRPQRFEDVVGQEQIVRTLQNQLESGRIAHAYLFAGPRGTGKTTMAKLFARAINCAHPINGDPCGECIACQAAQADDNMDIIEIDAASNNGVENIRDIRDKVVFAPANGKYKVYIIDEVHMLSIGAFNALLKTLEEPPSHVVFILATTEIHKLPATILSRCQRFDFKLISTSAIIQRLQYVLKESGADFDNDAISLIARSAEGGMRDALSLADVCLSYCGTHVTLSDAMGVLGISDRRFLFAFADTLLASDCAGALEKCRVLEAEGKDIAVFVKELMAHLRDLLIAVYSPASEGITTLPEDIRKALVTQAAKAEPQRLLRGIEILSRLESEFKLHNRPQIQLEVAAVRICTPETEQDLSALTDRVAKIENMIAEGLSVQAEKPVTKPIAPPVAEAAFPAERDAPPTEQDAPPWEEDAAGMPEAPVQKQKEPIKAAAPAAKPAAPAAKPVQSGLWRALLDRLKANDMPFYMMLRNFSGQRQENSFTIYIPASAQTRQTLIEHRADYLVKELEALCGEHLGVHVSTVPAPAEEQTNDMMKAAMDLFS